MSARIFEFSDYKEFLKTQIEEVSKHVPSYKAKLARAIGTPASFLSQVLHSHIQLNLDHGVKLARYLDFNEESTEYLLLLIQLSRATSSELRVYIEKKMKALAYKNNDLSQRFAKPQLDSNSEQVTYYSNWVVASIHMLLTITEYQNSETSVSRVAERLQLPEPIAKGYIDTLEKLGLIEKTMKNRKLLWQTTQKSIHLSKDHPLSPINHIQWRQYAFRNPYNIGLSGFHYTAVHSLSRSDMDVIQNIFTKTIEQSRDIVKDSKEEEIACLCFDFFKI